MTKETTTKVVHVYFLLDRSGSMNQLTDDVIGGFNAFRKEQITDDVTTLMTFVQFDSQDSQSMLTRALDIREVPELTTATYVPRGGTPLYDAMGELIATARIRHDACGGAEDVIFVVFTDGHENDSDEYDREKIFTLVEKSQELGWTFVFLGANQDSYAEGGRIAFDRRSIQNFDASADGVSRAFRSTSRALLREKGKIAHGVGRTPRDFFEGDKEAEQQ